MSKLIFHVKGSVSTMRRKANENSTCESEREIYRYYLIMQLLVKQLGCVTASSLFDWSNVVK